MSLGVTFIIVVVAVVLIWIFIEIKRLKHKLFAIFLIALIVFSYASATVIFKGKDINFISVDGIMLAGKLYFSWLVGVGGNIISLTGNAVKMDWIGTNSTKENS